MSSGPGSACRPRARHGLAVDADDGIALVLVLVVLTLVLAVVAALVSMTSMEARMAGADRARQAVRGAAEVALERALQEVVLAADWNAILVGAARSRFVDAGAGPPLGEWGVLDVTAMTTRLQRDTDAGNQWGPDVQRWRLFASASLEALMDASGPAAAGGGSGPGTGSGSTIGIGPAGPIYTAAWVADDAGDGDGNPAKDANGRVTVRAEAYGPFRSRQALVATVRRHGTTLEVLSWQVPDGG